MKKEFITINPATNENLSNYSYHNLGQIDDKIDLLKVQYKSWKQQTLEQRIKLLDVVQKAIKENVDELALLITSEMGKPSVEAKNEIIKTLTIFDYYRDHAEALLKSKIVSAQYRKSEIYFQPLGIVLSFMPWNFPVWQVFRFAVPAWLAGNLILQKHSEITAGVSLFIEKIVNESSGLTLMQNIFIEPKHIDYLYKHPAISAVTFTGSTQVGSLVAQQAAMNIKKAVLELGGNDAYIIDETAKMSDAVDWCVKSKLVNNGQSCVAAKRFFVPKDKSEEFIHGFVTKLLEKKIGSPLDKAIHLGPLAHQRFKQKIENQLLQLNKIPTMKSFSDIARLDLISIPQQGSFMVPRILVYSDISMKDEDLFIQHFQNEEIFGPVALVYLYESKEDLLFRVNQSQFGLGAAWFGDEEKFKHENWLRELDVGMIAVNEMIKSDARMPFGGVKKSGYGRELGDFGILEFCNIKTLGWG